MHITTFSVSNIRVWLESEWKIQFTPKLTPFLEEFSIEDADVVYHITEHSGEIIPEGEILQKNLGYRITRANDGIHYYFNVGTTLNGYMAVLRGTTLSLPVEHKELLLHNLDVTAMLGQELLLIHHNRLLMHASFVRYRGDGILFTGPSGMGKSTQAALWEKYMGAEILNGDKTILHIRQEGVTAYGSFYAGSSGIIRKEDAPLRAIVALRQGKENQIHRLFGREALLELLPHLATALWDGESHLQAMDLALMLAANIPVYVLTCRPDKEAVELTKQTITG